MGCCYTDYKKCWVWILLVSVVFVCYASLFSSHLHISIQRVVRAQFQSKYSTVFRSNDQAKYAYAGLLFVDDQATLLKYLTLAEVWCYQLKFVVKTTRDVFVYSYLNLTTVLIELNRTTLLDLGYKTMIFSDFNFTKELAEHKNFLTKSRSKYDESILEIELLSLYQYDCVIHMDFDMIMQKKLDSLFVHSPHRMYGLSDATAMLNNGLIVLTPNKDDYQNLKKFWKSASWGCNGVNDYNPIKRPYLSLLGICDASFNAGPQGVLPAYFYQYGEYVQLSDVHNFYISPASNHWNISLEDIYAFHLVFCKGLKKFNDQNLDLLKPYKPFDDLCLLLSSYLTELISATREQAQHMDLILKTPNLPNFSEKKNGAWVRSNLAAKVDMKTYCNNLHCKF